MGGTGREGGKVRVHRKTVTGCFGINSTICRAQEIMVVCSENTTKPTINTLKDVNFFVSSQVPVGDEAPI
jgi:hypothetical protein